MKKHIILITFIAVLMMLTVISRAATDTVTLKNSKDNVKPGETFTITICANSENGLNGLDATMEYDENIVEVSEAKIVDTTNWMDNLDSFPKITTMWKTTTEDTKQADIYVVTFKVKNGVTAKSTSIKLKGITLSTNSNDVTIEDITKEINITTEEIKGDNGSDTSGQGISTPSSNNNGSSDTSSTTNGTQTKTKITTTNTGTAKSSTTSNDDSSNKSLPYTGIETNILILALTILIAIFGIISYKLYKIYNI